MRRGPNSVFRDESIQSCNDPIRISDGVARLHLFKYIQKVLFFNSSKGNESDAGPILASDLITPHQDTAFLSLDDVLKPDNARMYRIIRLDANTYYAAIHDLGVIICAHETVKRDDLEGTS